MGQVNSLSPASSFDEKFKKIDPQMAELIKQLLVFNPDNRASAYESFSNPMFDGVRSKT